MIYLRWCAGSGAPDLITVRGARLERQMIVYAGSRVNPALLDYKKDGCEVYNSAKMTLEEVIAVMAPAAKAGKTVVRLHTGDPCVCGAHREQMDELINADSHRGLPGRVLVARVWQRHLCRVHTAECQPVGHPDAHGGPHARARKGAD